MLIFKLSGHAQTLVFTNSVQRLFQKYKQTDKNQAEAGGQLFAKITPKLIIVTTATGPHPRDKKGRFHFFPGLKRLRREIHSYFIKGLHYVGDWHTHPQINPRPSLLDLASMRLAYATSRHELHYFVLVVVGNGYNAQDVWVGLVNSRETIGLN